MLNSKNGKDIEELLLVSKNNYYREVKIMQTYTKEEVLKHCTRESCWIYIGNVVFVLCCSFYDLDMT